MRFGTAIERLVDNYQYAKSKIWIRDEVAWALYHTWKEADDRKTEPTISKMEQVDEPQTGEIMTEEEFDSMLARVLTGNAEPQTETEIAKEIVHKMIDDAVIAEDAYPDLRQKMHDAVDEYEPQTDCAWR